MSNTQDNGKDEREAEQHAAQGEGSTAYAERITGERDEKDPDGLVTLDQVPAGEDLGEAGDAPLADLNRPGNLYGTQE
ncbi:hypothetical protein [Planctomonas deserti]|uniref:hypothetical protein n=1 Tax=Planctomonas deserti TaxID=2144185 RepID=UPI000D340D21|nr:hypothetical protein [Planctomonas deserti]